MAALDYVEVPSSATRLHPQSSPSAIRPAQKIATSPPTPDQPDEQSISSTEWRSPPPKQRKKPFNIPSAILASGLLLDLPAPSNPRSAPQLVSTRDPLSLPLTTANFRRFAAKSGPIFWVQDRVEEVLFWRRGWKLTCAWMAAYAFLCYFPRLVLLIPHVIVLTVLLTANSTLHPAQSNRVDIPTSPITPQLPEGSPEWYANLQAIQNLMGITSDAYDFAMTLLPHLTFSSPYTYTILTVTFVSFVLTLPIIYTLPLRATFLFLGLAPFALTHPTTLYLLPALLKPFIKPAKMRLTRFVDDDRLEERHWRSELREVELWENERFVAGAGWSKLNLRVGERKAWTRGMDGWSDVRADGTGDVSNLTFALSPGWAFVETEDWRKDVEASWIGTDSDADGWVYTNDAWLHPHPGPLEEWKTNGLTRRRRWIRRIYYDPALEL